MKIYTADEPKDIDKWPKFEDLFPDLKKKNGAARKIKMIELKDKNPKCCDKEMHHEVNPQRLAVSSDAYIQEWVCLTCGAFITLTEDSLDEEELENYKEVRGC